MISNVGTQSAATNSILNSAPGQRAGYGGLRARQFEIGDTAGAARRIISDFDVDGSGSVDAGELRKVLTDHGIEGADGLAEQLSQGLGGESGTLTEQSLTERFDRQQRAMNIHIDLMQMQAAMTRPDAMTAPMPSDAPATSEMAPEALSGEAAPADPAAFEAAPAEADPMASTEAATMAVPDTAADEQAVAQAQALAPTQDAAAVPSSVSNRVGDFLARYDTDGDGTALASEIGAVLADRGFEAPKASADAMVRRFGGTADSLSATQIADSLRASDVAAAGLWTSTPELGDVATPENATASLDKVAVSLDGSSASDPMAVIGSEAKPAQAQAPSATDTTQTLQSTGAVASTGADAAIGTTAGSAVPTGAAPSAAARFSQLDTDGNGTISMDEFAAIDASAATPATVVTPDVGERLGSLLDSYRRVSGDSSYDDLRPIFSAKA